MKKIILLGCLVTFAMQMSAYAQLLNRTMEETVFKLPTMRSLDSIHNMPKSKRIQKQKEVEFELISKTVRNSEYLFIDNTLYTASRSLVSNFKDYKTIFDPFALTSQSDKYGRFEYDKPYTLCWELIGNMLYLTWLRIDDFDKKLLKDKSNFTDIGNSELHQRFEVFEKFENMTGRKFIKYGEKGYKKSQHPFFDKDRVMKADWVNGVYLLREWGKWGYVDGIMKNPWAIYPYSVRMVEFKNGVVVSSKVLDSSKY